MNLCLAEGVSPIVVNILQDTTIQINGSWKFLYINPENTSITVLMLKLVWNDLLVDVHSAPTLACFRKS